MPYIAIKSFPKDEETIKFKLEKEGETCFTIGRIVESESGKEAKGIVRYENEGALFSHGEA